jgi:hypothetical protein
MDPGQSSRHCAKRAKFLIFIKNINYLVSTLVRNQLDALDQLAGRSSAMSPTSNTWQLLDPKDVTAPATAALRYHVDQGAGRGPAPMHCLRPISPFVDLAVPHCRFSAILHCSLLNSGTDAFPGRMIKSED